MRKISNKGLKKKCDNLWSKIIRARAGWESELSGREDVKLDAHHIYGKANYILRFSLDNGICLCSMSEHLNGVHSPEKHIKDMYEEKIKHLRGEDIYDRMRDLKYSNQKVRLQDVYEFLTKELEKYERN